MLNTLYRTAVLLVIAVVLGLFLYWIAPDVTPYVGENGAALWSWFLIIASGIAAHFLLPRRDMSPVSDVLVALLTGSVVATIVAWVSALAVDLPLEQGPLSQLLLVGFSALGFGCLVFVPIHLIQRRLGRSTVLIYPVAGALLPAGLALVWQPLGTGFSEHLISAVVLGSLGASSAVGFAILTARLRSTRVETT